MSSPRRAWLLVVLFYGVAAALLIGPAWWSGPGRVVGGGDQPDWQGTAWAYWWTAHALAEGHSPFRSTLDFYPVGQYPLSQFNLLDAVLAAPLVAIFGTLLAYNIFAWLAVATTGLGGHILARVAGASHGAALSAGIALPTSIFLGRELEQGRLSQALLVFWLLGLAGLARLVRGEGGWKLAVLTGLSVVAAHYAYWYYGLFLLFAAVPLFLAGIRSWRTSLPRVGLAAAVTLALVLPAVVILGEAYATLPGVNRSVEGWMHYGAYGRGEHSLSMAIRHSHWPPWPLLHTATDPSDQRLALALLAMGLLPLAWRPVGRLKWFAVAAVGYVLTLGPWVKWDEGRPLNLRLPYLWFYEHLPFFDRLWWPDRIGIVVIAALGVLAALHIDRIAARWPRARWLVFGLPVVAIGLDAPLRSDYLPVVADPARPVVEDAYAGIEGALLTTPVLGNDADARNVLLAQAVHGQPILGGLGSWISGHTPPGYAEYIAANSLLDALSRLSGARWRSDLVIQPADIDQLIADGFRWAVVDPICWAPGTVRTWSDDHRQVFDALWGAADRQVKSVSLWRIEPIDAPVHLPSTMKIPYAGPPSAPAQIKQGPRTPAR